jgi:hypothetical protein
MPNEQTIQNRLKHYRSFEKICTEFHALWSGNSEFSGQFSQFSSAVLKLELLAYTDTTILNPETVNGKRRVVVNPKVLDETIDLLMVKIGYLMQNMIAWCDRFPNSDLCRKLKQIRQVN